MVVSNSNNKIVKHLISSITLLLLSTLAFGQVPNTFSSGETISSSKINANFAYLADAMENDNITAMMICRISGHSNVENKLYYGLCSSTNDQTFITKTTLYKNYFNSTDSRIESKSMSDVPNTISINDLFSDGWILFDSKQDLAIHDRGNGSSTHIVYFLERHIFYKVSD